MSCVPQLCRRFLRIGMFPLRRTNVNTRRRYLVFGGEVLGLLSPLCGGSRLDNPRRGYLGGWNVPIRLLRVEVGKTSNLLTFVVLLSVAV